MFRRVIYQARVAWLLATRNATNESRLQAARLRTNMPYKAIGARQTSYGRILSRGIVQATNPSKKLLSKESLLSIIDKPFASINQNDIEALTRKITLQQQINSFVERIYLIINNNCYSAKINSQQEQYLAQLLNELEHTHSRNKLLSLYKQLKTSPAFELFTDGYLPSYLVLDFLILGKFNQQIRDSLLIHTELGYLTPIDKSHKEKHDNDFAFFKPTFLAFLNFLQKQKFQIPSSTLTNLFGQIENSETMCGIISAIYNSSAGNDLKFKSWFMFAYKLKRMLANISEPTSKEITEALCLTLQAPEKLGIAYDLTEHMDLINSFVAAEHQQLVKEYAEAKTYGGEELTRYRNYLSHTYGLSTPPTEAHLKQLKICELKAALHLGQYQDSLQKMQETIDLYSCRKVANYR